MELLEFREKIELPDNWEWTTIDQILDSIESGGRPKGGVKGILEGVPSIGGEHLQYSGGFDFSNIRYIPIEFFKKLSKGKIKYSDVLVVKDGATTGKTSFVSESFPFINAAVNEHVFILRPDNNKVKPKFLFFWMQSQFGQNCVAANFKGTAQGGITTGFTKNSPFPLVPINDQINIISKIEELFTQLDAAEAALKRAKNNLKRYKQSLLQAAVTGELTREWREAHKDELEPANKLLERIKSERKAKWEAEIKAKGKDPEKEKYKEPNAPDVGDLPDLPEGWCWGTLPQIGEINRGKSKYRPRNASFLFGGPYPFIQTGDVKHSNGIIDKYNQTYSEDGLRQSRLWPAGTLCITIAANIAETGILTFDSCFPDSIVGFITFRNYININYIEKFIRSAQSLLERYAPATAQKNINLETLTKLAVALPPVIEQNEIITKLDEFSSIINHNVDAIDKSLNRISRLRQSILQKAFTGQLIQSKTEERE